MEWISAHMEELAGGVLLLVGLIALLFPKALLPGKRMEQMKKIHFTEPFHAPDKEKKREEEFPLALSLFLRFTGLLFAFAGVMILLARR